uniref:Hint domain-containing protein n=1 Tax=Chromera velia CCMP2878 TaxID=1169474 RepID=A0A0G4HAF2_9ALVE|eukprot:Cvel_895.t1-p1 / transcript=Cvel_895.t1 / gene=Cvel_895 / organism=Chromera_velia_CCMP2878 / gene_product=hypothetical protein / transcript_product=hypothetical protein / location=Cvel_scaffold28:77617-78774(-) / protein_length=386 / sequence_SO=supercontig / SO=protein_coding / is_pseudo=false
MVRFSGHCLLFWAQFLVLFLGTPVVGGFTQMYVEMSSECTRRLASGRCDKWEHNGRMISPLACFPEGTLVQTSEGIVGIENLQVDDEVLAFDTRRETLEYTRLRGWLHRVENEVFEFLTLNGDLGSSITLSKRHNIAVRNGDGGGAGGISFKFAEDVIVGEFLINAEGVTEMVTDIQTVYARGLFAPLTENFVILTASPESPEQTEKEEAGEDTLVTHTPAFRGFLAHNFAHISRPQMWQGLFGLLLSGAEWLSPSINDLPSAVSSKLLQIDAQRQPTGTETATVTNRRRLDVPAYTHPLASFLQTLFPFVLVPEGLHDNPLTFVSPPGALPAQVRRLDTGSDAEAEREKRGMERITTTSMLATVEHVLINEDDDDDAHDSHEEQE